MRWIPVVLVLALAVASAPAAGASALGEQAGLTNPSVPVSALALPDLSFDPSRLHVTMSFAMGTGFGTGTSGLQTTSLSYQFRQPLWLQVSLGNQLGSGLGANA